MARPVLRSLLAGASITAVLLGPPAARSMSISDPPAPATAAQAVLAPVEFSSIEGWNDDGLAAAVAVFAASCRSMLTALSNDAARRAWTAACASAQAVPQDDDQAARRMLEQNFNAWRISPSSGADGFLTGYFEPEVEGALVRSDAFPVPLYRQPDDLIVLGEDDIRRPAGFALAGARNGTSGLEPYPTRQEIETGALAGRGLELVHVRDKITAFFIHVQGSARIRLAEGGVMRIGFAAKNGHPYRSIGRHVAETWNIAPEEMTADRLRDWLAAHADQADAVMWHNKSFIFFRRIDEADDALGPLGALGVALTPLRSLAVDRSLHVLGAPLWIDAMLPDAQSAQGGTSPFRRLMIAQDTGSAIVGPARGDIFFGTGADAGHQAGLVRHAGRFTLLWPKGLALPAWAKAAQD